jgi:DNA mismatch endonuclease, patch repair protein
MNAEMDRNSKPDVAVSRAAQRSATMRAVKSRNTAPELLLRNMLRSIAPGYRLHRADLPGKPDIVYGPRRLAIFMHGCFWHGHDCKRGARAPKDNAAYWSAKIAGNRARDAVNVEALAARGWRTLVVFECALKDRPALERRLREALNSDQGGDDEGTSRHAGAA